MGLHHPSAGHPAHHWTGSGRAARFGILALGALALAVPLPLAALGAWRQGYVWIQPAITRVTGLLPVAALDLGIVGLTAVALASVVRRRANIHLMRAAIDIAVATALLWLSFLGLWGWHYQVPTIETRLALPPDAIGPPGGEAFARATVAQLNRLYAEAHASAWPTRDDLPRILAPRLANVLPRLGVARLPALPAPRRTILDWYFRAAGIDGMTNPFGLEVLMNSKVLPLELPALAAHEYAHLAGFADEADASVVAWLACQDGSPALRYSSAIAVLSHLLTGLPGATQRDVIAGLAAGPRGDLRAIAARLADQQPWVHALAWFTYDGFLRANRVKEGVARYDAVARVLIGAADPATGTLRRWPPPWPPSR